MFLPSAMDWVAQEDSLNVDLAVLIAVLPGRLLQKIERELLKSNARRRAGRKAASRRMRRLIRSNLLRRAEASPADFGKAENSSFLASQPFNAPKPVQHLPTPPTEPVPPPPPPSPPPPPPPPPIPRAPAASATAPELERKVARLETELQIRGRSRQKRNDAFHSLKLSEHTKMLQLMDANDQINRLEAELQETKKKTVAWLHLAERYKAERYEKFAPLLDQIPSIPPPPRAIEWGILARQLEFWAGVVIFIMLLAVVYAVGKYLANDAPAITISCPRQIPCPRPPRVENHWPPSFAIAECPSVECPRVLDCPTGTDLPTVEKCSGHRHLLAPFAIGVVMGGFSTWQTVLAMD